MNGTDGTRPDATRTTDAGAGGPGTGGAAGGGSPGATGSATGAATPGAAGGGPAPGRGPGVRRSVGYAGKRIQVDGEDTLLLSGEVHYFRLARADWADRIDKARAAGLDTIATYIPWIWHELPDGTVDVTGRTRPERDLGAFLDLCHARGMRVIARPGPFVMAELKNEGLPYRLYRDHPAIVPSGWDGVPAPTRTVDYLAPEFLAEVRAWYRAVLPVLARRLHGDGGPVVAVQLDNEVGMLAWVSNSPDLTDHLCDDFAGWLERVHGEGLAARYPFTRLPAAGRRAAVRSPRDGDAAALTRDLGRFMRGRFARYLATLRGYARECGITGVPFLVNIHGTGGGRAETFPVGISQLMESYRGVPGTISGSDIYLGDLTVANAADLYLVNAFMDAAHDDDQPLTSLEFEAGTFDYGDTWEALADPSAVDLKTRMCLAQGNRLLNYYLFAGGVNPPLDEPVGDGNDRLAFTGERHGFAAPVTPEGGPGPAWAPTARTLHTVRANARVLAAAAPELDGVTLGFVPDHWLTEYHHPGSPSARAVLDDVTGVRGAGPGGAMARAMLLGGFRFGALDVQAHAPDPARHPVLAVATGDRMPADAQRHLAAHLAAGGRLLLAGRLPALTMDGLPCTVLRDALGVRVTGEVRGSGTFFPSAAAHAWAAPAPEVRFGRGQLLDGQGEVGLRELSTGRAVALHTEAGAGRALLVTADVPARLPFWRAALAALGAVPALTAPGATTGLLLLSGAAPDGSRLLHALNVSPYAQDFTVHEHGRPLFGGAPVHLPGRGALMLPLAAPAGPPRLRYATAEVTGHNGGAVAFRSYGPAVVALRGTAAATTDAPGARVGAEGGATVVRTAGAGEFTVTV